MMITQKSKPHTFVIPIFKDNKTYLYYTNRTVGQPPLVVKLVVELGGSALFFQCDRISYNSTTYTHVLCVFEDSGWSDLPNGANSILGLADSSMSFVKSVESSYKIPFKVALCLPSKPKNNSGSVYIGSRPYLLPPDHRDTSIYRALVKAFVGKAQRKAVYPFRDCFSYKSFGGKSLLGKKTPVISFVLGGGAKWDIYGTNSLVMVNKTIMCLAFVDARNDPRFPIEMGGYQMEDHLVEFDFEASTFSFTSSLLRHNASCSRM
ncbi:hypothetical protein F2Q69_00020295 [Brassica cretica]|uniref:Peptidase A1 domain-containing protein n=1 Tax=Brassica cretica TaxID=69181 RepID=A0A8S9QFD8_BRACR|nr:hypothetical protein F2Q69_00020295 [Brassica cretica]